MISKVFTKSTDKLTEPPTGQPETTDQTPTNPREDEPASDRLPKDIVFDMLSAHRRRMVLRYLAENDSKTTLSDLAEHIASHENDKPISALSASERKRVYIGLHQCHLPRMADANIIDYNQPRGTLELRQEAHQLLTHLPNKPEDTNHQPTGIRRFINAPIQTIREKLPK